MALGDSKVSHGLARKFLTEARKAAKAGSPEHLAVRAVIEDGFGEKELREAAAKLKDGQKLRESEILLLLAARSALADEGQAGMKLAEAWRVLRNQEREAGYAWPYALLKVKVDHAGRPGT